MRDEDKEAIAEIDRQIRALREEDKRLANMLRVVVVTTFLFIVIAFISVILIEFGVNNG
jgi:hypothetical protein